MRKTWYFPNKENFYFQWHLDESKPLEEIRNWEHPPLVRHRPIQGESKIDFLGDSEGSLPQPHDSLPDAGEAINDFWCMSGSFIYRHHVEPRVKLFAERRIIPYSTEVHWRDQNYSYEFGCQAGETHWWLLEQYGSRDLSDPWTGFTQFTLLDEKAPDGFMWSGRRLTRKQLTSKPDHLWPELWKSMRKHAKLKEKQKWAEEKLHLENPRKLRGISFIDPEDKEFKETIKNARKKLETSVAPAMPCKFWTSLGTQRSLQKVLEPERKPKVIYTDNSLEFGKACEDLSWNHCTSTPHRSETNGIAERAVRRVKEGTSAVLLQSGLNESWWADSMECYTYLRNVTDLLSDGKTPYERRFGQPFKGPIIPFGSLVEYHPITAKDQSRIHQFGKKVLPGLFLGYALYAGGIWKGDVLIADLEELETMDALEIYSKRLDAKDVVFPKQGEFFPIADGRIKFHGGDQEHPPWNGTVQFDEKVTYIFLENQKGLFYHFMTHFRMPVKRWLIFGPCQETSYTAITFKLYSPREESFLFPLKYSDVTRTTHTNLGVTQERRIDDYWNIDGSRDLSRSWTGFTEFTLLEETSRRIYVVRVKINKKTAYIQARSSMARNLEVNGKACQAEGEAKVVTWKTKLDNVKMWEVFQKRLRTWAV